MDIGIGGIKTEGWKFRDANSVSTTLPASTSGESASLRIFSPSVTAGSRHRHGRKPTVDARHSVSLIALINKGQSGGGQGEGGRERVGRRREGKRAEVGGR